MHSAFLYHATRQGLDMCIVNAGMLEVYDNIPKDRLKLIEDVLLNRDPDATERLTDYAEKLAAEKTEAGTEKKPVLEWREQDVAETLGVFPYQGHYRVCGRGYGGGVPGAGFPAERD